MGFFDGFVDTFKKTGQQVIDFTVAAPKFVNDVTFKGKGAKRASESLVHDLTFGFANPNMGIGFNPQSLARPRNSPAATAEKELIDEKEAQRMRAYMFRSMANPTGARGLPISASNQMGLIGSMRPLSAFPVGSAPSNKMSAAKPGGSASGGSFSVFRNNMR